MIQIAALREQPDEWVARLGRRGIPARQMVDEILELDRKVRMLRQSVEEQQAESNQLAREIGQFFKEGKQKEAETLRARTLELKDSQKIFEEQLRDAEAALEKAMLNLPNAPHHSVPDGRSAEDNQEVFTWGVPPEFTFTPLPHWELAKKYNLIDFELGVKITGAGFPVYIGKGAQLQRALINFFLDSARAEGYTEVQPPILVNADSGYGTGQLPDKEGQMYHAGVDDLYLIPTAEVPVTNLYRDVILEAGSMPVKNAAYTPCFRREAGSYGKDVRGLNRLHQFDKVEIVQIARPDLSYAVLEEMQQYVQGLLQKLGLHYRVLRLCAGDMGFTSALTYDMEVYSAAQQRWLEVSSVSNFEAFQANRLKLRYRDESGKPRLAHTLNGSALALPRIVAALLENNQNAGHIVIPEVLHPYLGFDRIVE